MSATRAFGSTSEVARCASLPRILLPVPAATQWRVPQLLRIVQLVGESRRQPAQRKQALSLPMIDWLERSWVIPSIRWTAIGNHSRKLSNSAAPITQNSQSVTAYRTPVRHLIHTFDKRLGGARVDAALVGA